jgi:hypothetical protein
LYNLGNIDTSKEYSVNDDDDDETAKAAGDSMSYAAAFDFIMGMTSVNLFFRSWPKNWTDTSVNRPDPVFGLELKRTLLGFDVYGQGAVNINPKQTMKAEDVQQYRLIGGFYRLWDNPRLGINAEYMFYRDVDNDVEEQKIGLTAGLSHLFGNRIALVLAWKHTCMESVGSITPGFAIINVFPNASLQTGIKFSYGANKDDPTKPWLDISAGSKIVLKVNY